jgi:hypothetical protein
VKLDLLPSFANEVSSNRSSIEVLARGQEEEPSTAGGQAESEMIQECAEVNDGGSGKLRYVEQSYSCVVKLLLENQAIATEFVLKNTPEEGSVICWHILYEEEKITECPMTREHESMSDVETIWEGILIISSHL